MISVSFRKNARCPVSVFQTGQAPHEGGDMLAYGALRDGDIFYPSVRPSEPLANTSRGFFAAGLERRQTRETSCVR